MCTWSPLIHIGVLKYICSFILDVLGNRDMNIRIKRRRLLLHFMACTKQFRFLLNLWLTTIETKRSVLNIYCEWYVYVYTQGWCPTEPVNCATLLAGGRLHVAPSEWTPCYWPVRRYIYNIYSKRITPGRIGNVDSCKILYIQICLYPHRIHSLVNLQETKCYLGVEYGKLLRLYKLTFNLLSYNFKIIIRQPFICKSTYFSSMV